MAAPYLFQILTPLPSLCLVLAPIVLVGITWLHQYIGARSFAALIQHIYLWNIVHCTKRRKAALSTNNQDFADFLYVFSTNTVHWCEMVSSTIVLYGAIQYNVSSTSPIISAGVTEMEIKLTMKEH
jgi:hypothetical protein